MKTRTLTIEYSQLTDETDLTVLYARLSKDDGSAGDSDSILNQRMLLENYARDQKLSNCVFFADDGISGTTFNRPAFQQAIKLVEAGRVKTFVVKDLSWFGRDYLKVGAFTEVAFPEKGVRFIAINDNVDSDHEDDNSLAPFRNLFNEWYARDCSKKIKAVKHAKGNAGEPMAAMPPYGYIKDPKDKKKWLIDEEAATNVRRIFNDCASGKSLRMIVAELEKDKILIPARYKHSKGIAISKVGTYPYRWSYDVVGYILKNYAYCGHTINFKTYKKSYKSKKFYVNPEEKRKIFRDTHEAIIDEKTFALVQELRQTHTARHTKLDKVGLFSGIVVCSDCGHRHYFDRVKERYYCSGNSSRLKYCTLGPHAISESSLSEIVLQDLGRLGALIKEHESELVDELRLRFEIEDSKTVAVEESQLVASQKRLSELDAIFVKLYEDNLSGKVTDSQFSKLSERFEKEQQELTEKVTEIRKKMSHSQGKATEVTDFLSSVKKYLEPTELTSRMVRELIDKIEVGQATGRGSKRQQEIKITYRFVGELPAGE